MTISNGDMVTGECRCCGTVITGRAGTLAQPGTFIHRDILTGKSMRCWAVVEANLADVPRASPHDLPVSGIVRTMPHT